jgi:hypothetical protein
MVVGGGGQHLVCFVWCYWCPVALRNDMRDVYHRPKIFQASKKFSIMGKPFLYAGGF